MMTITEILSHFDGVKSSGQNRYQCKCPAHDDRQASLSITQKDNKILLHCHAGCNTETILGMAGLTFADLGSEKEPERKSWIDYIENSVNRNSEIKYHFVKEYRYTDEKGSYQYSKIRLEGVGADGKKAKTFRYGIRTDDKIILCGKGKNTIYNLPAVLKAIADGRDIYVTEGEKDVETLSKMGYPACTVGGANDWKDDYAKSFKGAKLIILPDNDDPGRNLAEVIKRGTRNFAYCTKIVPTAEAAKGDITDFFEKENHTKDDFKRLVDMEQWHYNFCNENGKTNTDILADIFAKNENPIQIIREADDKSDMYFYDNGVWTQQNRDQIKGRIKDYIPLGYASDKTLSDTYNLLRTRRNNVFSVNKLNSDTRYINVKNGLYDTETRQLIPHDSKITSTIQLKCSYRPTAPTPTRFLEFIDDMCTDKNGEVNDEIKTVIQEWLGIVLSNIHISALKKSWVLYSTKGNTGKSVLLNIIAGLVGEKNTINIPIQKLSDRFSMGDVYGKRLIMVGDQASGSIDDISAFKQLTGGDPIRVEQKGKTGFEYRFTGGMIMACNDLPKIKDDKGDHLFERFFVVPLVNSIPEEKRDKDLLSKIMNNEADGVLLWALEGLHRFLDNGKCFTKCKACDDIMSAYRSESDTVYEFIHTNYILTGDTSDKIKTTELYKDYFEWCSAEVRAPLSKPNFKKRLEKNGVICSPYAGCYYYRGIKEKDFIDVTERYDFDENIFQEKCV